MIDMPRIRILARRRATVVTKSLTTTTPHVTTERDIYDLFRECRKEGVVIRGGRGQMEAVLSRKRRTTRYKHPPVDLVGRCYIAYFLWKLGNGPQVQRCYNSHDFYSSAPVSRIPRIFIYCTMGYAFDIRSLLAYGDSKDQGSRINLELWNPYTGQTLADSQFGRKVRWLHRLGYDLRLNITSQTGDIAQYITNVFSLISRHQYVDYQWYADLTLVQLQKLYRELHKIWNGRLPMNSAYRSDIISGNRTSLFDHKNMQRYNCELLRMELLKDIHRLVTEGLTEDHRKSGCYIFMLGLVLVSDPASRCHPTIFEVSRY